MQLTRSLRVRERGAQSLLSLLLAGALSVGGIVESSFAAVRSEDTIGSLPVSSLSAEAAGFAPDVEIPAGILVADDGRVLWAREADERRAMASTTKIMTAVVALDSADLDAQVVVSKRAARFGQGAIRLREGESYSLRTLLETLLVRSGNDAATAIAEHVSGSVEEFVARMNAKAQELGLDGTRFANPHGLDAVGHYSTATDLATLARQAMANPEFRETVGLERITIENVEGSGEVENTNLLITTVEGATGVKTGWTGQAGFCLVASAKRDELELFAVVLGADGGLDRFKEASFLLEWGFVHYTEEILAESGVLMGDVVVEDYLDTTVSVLVAEPVMLRVLGLGGPVTQEVSLPETINAPIQAGDTVGTLSFIQGERLIGQVPLVAEETVRRPTLPERAWISIVRTWRSVFGGSE